MDFDKGKRLTRSDLIRTLRNFDSELMRQAADMLESDGQPIEKAPGAMSKCIHPSLIVKEYVSIQLFEVLCEDCGYTIWKGSDLSGAVFSGHGDGELHIIHKLHAPPLGSGSV